jgi:hypothetical protein
VCRELEQLVPWDRIAGKAIGRVERSRGIARSPTQACADWDAFGEPQVNGEAIAGSLQHSCGGAYREVLAVLPDLGS